MDLVGTFALREKSEYVIFGDGIFADPSNKLLPIRSSNNDSHSMNAEDLSFGFVKGFFFIHAGGHGNEKSRTAAIKCWDNVILHN